MNRTSIFLLPLLLAAITPQAQVALPGFGLQPEKPISPWFRWNKNFEHPSALPDRLAAVLQSNEANRKKFNACQSRGDVPDIPSAWFVATKVNIAEDEPPALLVKPTHACLLDSDRGTAPFWMFRETENDYALLFTVETGALQVLQETHNGYHNLRTSIGAYSTYWNTSYRYEGGQYKEYVSSVVNID